MQLLDSEWFFRMVEQHGKSPAARLEAVFTVTSQWISAPGIKETFTDPQALQINTRLKSYLTETAQSASAENPAMLASQLIILLQGGISEALRQPGINALQNAASAAQTVIAQACRPRRMRPRIPWSAVASLAIVLTAAITWHLFPGPSDVMLARATLAPQSRPYIQTTIAPPVGISPGDVEEALNLQEQFNRGTCAPPHLLALPPEQVTAYMDVIHFRTPENIEADRKNLRAFLTWFNQTRAGKCYFAPANGHTLVTWR